MQTLNIDVHFAKQNLKWQNEKKANEIGTIEVETKKANEIDGTSLDKCNTIHSAGERWYYSTFCDKL